MLDPHSFLRIGSAFGLSWFWPRWRIAGYSPWIPAVAPDGLVPTLSPLYPSVFSAPAGVDVGTFVNLYSTGFLIFRIGHTKCTGNVAEAFGAVPDSDERLGL
jgi:hypothetical protein